MDAKRGLVGRVNADRPAGETNPGGFIRDAVRDIRSLILMASGGRPFPGLIHALDPRHRVPYRHGDFMKTSFATNATTGATR